GSGVVTDRAAPRKVRELAKMAGIKAIRRTCARILWITSDEIWATRSSFDHWVENADDQVTARFPSCSRLHGPKQLARCCLRSVHRHSCHSGGAVSVVAFGERRPSRPITGAGGGVDTVLCPCSRHTRTRRYRFAFAVHIL